MKEGSPACWEEAGRGHLVLDHCLARLTVSLTLPPSGVHECCMAWLGHPHVPVPSNFEVVPQLPHRQVGEPGGRVAALHTAALCPILL